MTMPMKSNASICDISGCSMGYLCLPQHASRIVSRVEGFTLSPS